MADKLEECGYDYTFYKIEGADHGSWEFWTDETFDIVDEFFKGYLRNRLIRNSLLSDFCLKKGWNSSVPAGGMKVLGKCRKYKGS